MNEIIAVGAENVAETQNLFRGIAGKYKDPNNQQSTLMGLSDEIREKLNIKGPNYVPGYNFSQAITEQILHNKDWIDRRGGLQKTSEGFLKFIENMGINTQDPNMPLKRLAEEYLLRPYITKGTPVEAPAPARTPQEEAAGEVAAEETTESPPKEVAAEETTQTPVRETGRIRKMLASTLNKVLVGLDDQRITNQQALEDLRYAFSSLAGKVPDLFRRTPKEVTEGALLTTAETPPEPEATVTVAEAAAPEILTPEEAEALRDVSRRPLWVTHAKIVLGLERPEKRTLEGINRYYNGLGREGYILTPEEDDLQKRIQKRIADRMYD